MSDIDKCSKEDTAWLEHGEYQVTFFPCRSRKAFLGRCLMRRHLNEVRLWIRWMWGNVFPVEGTSRVKAQRQEYAGHVLGASWWGWGWGFRSRSGRYKESCRDRPGLCGYKWQKIQLLLAELRRKCISSSEWSAQGSSLWTRVRRGPDLKGKMLTRPKEKNIHNLGHEGSWVEQKCSWMCMRSGSRNDQRVTKAHHGREGREIGEGKRITISV